jgi:hypothetical protein
MNRSPSPRRSKSTSPRRFSRRTCVMETLEMRTLLTVASAVSAPAELISAAQITDQQKQQLMLQMVDTYCGPLAPEYVLAEIRQEGGAGAFYADGALYDSFYMASQAPWAQPDDNTDGIMQVTPASGDYEKSGTYTDDQPGYEHAIDDGCTYLIATFDQYGTLWQTALHYNTGPSSLYVYLGLGGGDPQYLAHIASDLQSFVPSIYALSDTALVTQLNAAQQIVNSFLNNPNIAKDQSASYYSPYETQLDNQLHALGASGVVTDTWTGNASNLWSNPGNWSNGAIPAAANVVEFNNGSAIDNSAINVANLIISNATLQLAAGGGASSISSLTIYGTGDLDLTNNILKINYGTSATPVATIAGYLATGYNGGSWNGTGIVSSSVAALNLSQSALIYSIGYADGADGITGVPSGEIEIMPTFAGDAKMQGNVVFGDFQLLSQYFGQTGTSWDEGNFTYGSTTNFGDFQLLSQNFGQTAVLATSSNSIASAPVTIDSSELEPSPLDGNAAALILESGGEPFDLA